MSTQDQRYKSIPIHSDKIGEKDKSEMKEIGYIDLNQINHKLFIKSHIPPQSFEVPGNPSKKEILNSFEGQTLILPEKTGRNWTIITIAFFTILSICFSFIEKILP